MLKLNFKYIKISNWYYLSLRAAKCQKPLAASVVRFAQPIAHVCGFIHLRTKIRFSFLFFFYFLLLLAISNCITIYKTVHSHLNTYGLILNVLLRIKECITLKIWSLVFLFYFVVRRKILGLSTFNSKRKNLPIHAIADSFTQSNAGSGITLK